MKTQLVFLVGTNPLPIWVAWHHLCPKLQPVQVRFVHTKDTTDEMNRLKEFCRSDEFRLLDAVQTSPGDPGTIRKDINDVCRAISNEDTNLHVHYTGGTKAMAVETVVTVQSLLPSQDDWTTSYLDPRASGGPAIIDRRGRVWVQDARIGIDANLRQVAQLNGFKIAPFRHRYRRHDSSTEIKGPKEPDPDELKMGEKALSNPKCRDGGKWLEFGAYGSLKKALKSISDENRQRSNYALFHSVCIKRTGSKEWDKCFELDVVVVLGYQIVVVSCSSTLQQHIIKQKAMEVTVRARQLGGDEARAVVLCCASASVARRVQDEVQDEMGSADIPLQVWGKDRLKNLSQAFNGFLQDLYWR